MLPPPPPARPPLPARCLTRAATRPWRAQVEHNNAVEYADFTLECLICHEFGQALPAVHLAVLCADAPEAPSAVDLGIWRWLGGAVNRHAVPDGGFTAPRLLVGPVRPPPPAPGNSGGVDLRLWKHLGGRLSVAAQLDAEMCAPHVSFRVETQQQWAALVGAAAADAEKYSSPAARATALQRELIRALVGARGRCYLVRS